MNAIELPTDGLSTATPIPAVIAAPGSHSRTMRIPGNTGIWVGIFCVLVEFFLLFSVYFIAKAHHPEAFATGPDKLATIAGVSITVFLLTSGYCMVKAVAAIRLNNRRAATVWTWLAFTLGLGYPVIKFFEIGWNVSHGVDGEAGIFYTTYYYLTLNHLVHVTWGLIGLAWAGTRSAVGIYTADDYAGLEAAAVYWHTNDLIWLVIFPLFYVLK